MARKKKNKSNFLGNLGTLLWFLIKIPYYLVKGGIYLGKGIYSLAKYSEKKIEENKVKNKRESITAKYKEFEVLQTVKGDYKEWEKSINSSDSKIGIILGARGTGKTAFGMKFMENTRAKYKKKCFALGFDANEMPSWIKAVQDVKEIENNSFVLIDEGGILFSSRNSMSNANKLLSELILIARHKNLSILFISQNSSNLDINILRQADFLVLKPSSLLQKEFERKIIQKIYDVADSDFEKLKDKKGLTHIYSNDFVGFVSNPLPSFWGENISKSFRQK